MPAIVQSMLLALRQEASGTLLPSANNTATQPDPGVGVICAWPVSGQYGPGTRFLYYMLVAACVVARKVEWLRNACLAGALLFPVTAGVHGVVLAAVHVDGAVDMDIYGALQLCAIGVLIAPITVRLSSTYSREQGRNIIFVWSGIIFAGLISLVVEFYRANPYTCTTNYNGEPFTNRNQFPYSLGNFTCGLTCDTNSGPSSPIRLGSANNIYVIAAPSVLTFDAGTLLAAACCIPTILLPASMWIKILRQNHKKREEQQRTEQEASSGGHDGTDEISVVQGTTTASDQGSSAPSNPEEEGDEKGRRVFQKYPAAIIFGGVVFAILVVGEMNLFSEQVSYQTDYMPNVGQWAPLVGTGLAVLGSVYLLLTQAMDEEREFMKPAETSSEQQAQPNQGKAHHGATTTTELRQEPLHHNSRTVRRMARVLIRISDFLSDPSDDRFEDSRSHAMALQRFPEIPGEDFRVAHLQRIRSNYTHRNSNESSISHNGTVPRHRSDTTSTAPRQCSDTVSSSRSHTEVQRVSTEIQPVTRGRRDTLEVPVHQQSTPGSLPSPPIDIDMSTPIDSSAPAIVISND